MPGKLKTRADRLCTDLRSVLETMPEGYLLPSTREIQKKYSVSRRVVFAALNQMKKEKLISIVPKVGVFSTGTLCRKRGALVHLCLPEYPSRWQFSFLEELERFSTRSGLVHYRKRLYNGEKSSYVQALESNCDAAAVIAAGRDITPDELRGLLNYPHPLLFISKHLEELPINSIAMNDHICGVLAAEYLLEKGHRQLGVLICEPHLYGTYMIADMFNHVVKCAGASCVMIDCKMKPEQLPQQAAFDTILPFLEQEKLMFTALFVINDTAAPGVLRACRETNRSIPEDLSLLCSGELPDDAKFPTPLTTVGISSTEMAAAVSETLLDMIGNPNRVFHVNLTPRLYERASVQPPAPTLPPQQ
ncbi:LacI family DNA-binding transcriptional regulator [uncultured Victivallis sp.]|uniref:LacI family DNA-binding transcriptional regulator n=1 Tax=uncultured Victivallis sp. TaxID=354118 RepID=UPI0025D3FE5E|nr:LacI family DNA-binding transcriptional regulator [uncultured Victivallis sp.]